MQTVTGSPMIVKRCLKCRKRFQCPSKGNTLYCQPSHRKTYKAPFNGQSGTYSINGMACAEFAFQVVMMRQGIRVEKIRAGGTLFYMNGIRYRPDFYDTKRKVYYEVSGSRQALHMSRPKLKMMKQYHPKVKLVLVTPDGTEIQ